MRRSCETDDTDYAVWPLMLEAQAALLERVQEEIGDLPLTWYDVLVQLRRADDGQLAMRRLAESVLLSKSGITRLVDRMEAAGYIERASCPTDRRIVYARITDRGRAAYDEAMPKAVSTIREHFLSLVSDTETRAMRNAFTRVLEAADQKASAENAG